MSHKVETGCLNTGTKMLHKGDKITAEDLRGGAESLKELEARGLVIPFTAEDEKAAAEAIAAAEAEAKAKAEAKEKAAAEAEAGFDVTDTDGLADMKISNKNKSGKQSGKK